MLWRKEETGRRQLLGVAVSPDATRLALGFAVATRDGAPADTGDVEVWAPPD